ncbi:MAG: polysaccharide biosynthesis C-terminal domain-containing protein [Pirellulaceae bacterium]|jgi:O-antigen/teichoic acid export membrane protein|nr:polysaccharide biosynthesis C-terminal domain-containing protein [Pirellulaceae bacterium]
MVETKLADRAAARTGTVMLNAASNYLRFFVMMAGMFLLTPFIIKHIGQEEFGLWMLVMCVVGYFELLDCGMATATVKFVGQFRGAGDTVQRDRLVSTLLLVYVLMAATIGLMGIGLAFFFSEIFQIAPAQQQKAIAILLMLAAKVALNLPLSLFLGVLFGQQRIFAVNLVRIAAYLTYAVLAAFALHAGGGLIVLAALNAVIFFLEHLMFFVVCRWSTPDLRVRWGKFDRRVFRQVAAFSSFALITNIATVVLLRTDPIVVKMFLPLAAVAVYALALKIAEQVLQLTKQFINVFTPLIAEMHGAGDRAGVRAAFLTSSKFGLATLAAISIPAMYWAGEAMTLWVGPEFRLAGPIMAMLIGAMHFKVLHEGASNVLGMTGGHRYVAATSILNAVVNLGLSLMLIIPFGLPGVAFATIAATGVIGMLFVVRKVCRDYEVGAVEYWSTTVGPVTRPALLSLTACLLLRHWCEPSSLIELALLMGGATAVFGAAFVAMAITSSEWTILERKLPWIRRWRAGKSTTPAEAS